LAAVLDAAFTELEGAIGALGTAVKDSGGGPGGRSRGTEAAERKLLKAAFADAPIPLFLLALDGTVLRVSKTAAQLLGAKPGYATGRSFTAFVALSGRAAVQTQLTAVARSGKTRRIRCDLLGPNGQVPSLLTVGVVRVSGDEDQLVVGVTGTS